MTDTIQLRCEIGGTDYGTAGQKLLLPGFRLTASGPGRIGGGQLPLEGAPGVDAAIVNQALVHLYLFNVTQNRISQELFIGSVAGREMGQVPGTTQKTWLIDLQDLNLQMDSLVSKAATSQGIHLTAATFPNQIAQLFTQLTTGASKTFDATTYVLDCAAGQTLPAQTLTGLSLGDMLAAIYAAARTAVPSARPVGTFTPDPALLGPIGTTWMTPVLQVWDAAAPPVPGKKYSNAGPDGSHYAILPEAPFSRRLESPRLVNWRQIMDANGVVHTGQDTTSIATYPNPWDPDGAWKGPAIHDTQHLAVGNVATAVAVLSGSVVDHVNVTWGGVGYYTPPGVRLVGGGSPTRVATAIATVDGLTHVLQVIMLDGGAGYTSAPTVAFDDALQLAINGQVAPVANPRERLTILTDTPAMAGTYVGVTLTLESGIVDLAYLVNAITADFGNPHRPLYTLELGARALRLGEQAADDVYAPPIEGVRLNPPDRWALIRNVYAPDIQRTKLQFTWLPPVAPPGRHLAYYELHLYLSGAWETHTIPGVNPGLIILQVLPGQAGTLAYLLAVDSLGARSLPTPTIGPFTTAPRYDPPPNLLPAWTPDPGVAFDPSAAGYKTAGAWVFALETGLVDDSGNPVVDDSGNPAVGEGTLRLVSDPLPVRAALALALQLAYQRDSGGALTSWNIYVDWYSTADASSGFLSTTTVTPSAPSTSWATTDDQGKAQVSAVANALSGVIRLVAVAALAVTLTAAIYGGPAPAGLPANLHLGTDSTAPLIIYDRSDDSAQAQLYASGAYNLFIQGLNTGRNEIGITTPDGSTLVVGGNGGAAQVAVSGGRLNLDRAPQLPVRAIAGTATVAVTDYLMTLSGTTNYTVTLPAANAVPAGTPFLLIRTSAAGITTFTVAAAGSDTIEGAANKTLTAQYQKLYLVSDGTSVWWSLLV